MPILRQLLLSCRARKIGDSYCKLMLNYFFFLWWLSYGLNPQIHIKTLSTKLMRFSNIDLNFSLHSQLFKHWSIHLFSAGLWDLILSRLWFVPPKLILPLVAIVMFLINLKQIVSEIANTRFITNVILSVE